MIKMSKTCYAPDWWYHDESLELPDDYCHHGNFYEDCEECELEENPETETEDVD